MNRKSRVGIAVCLGLSGSLFSCLQSESGQDPAFGSQADTATWPTTFYVGGDYSLKLAAGVFPETSACVAVDPQDSGIVVEEGFADGTGLYVTIKPRSDMLGEDTLRIVADCPNLKGTLEYPFAVTHAVGFAPIASMQSSTYEKRHSSACARQNGGVEDSVRVVLTTLGTSAEGYLFRRTQQGASYMIRVGKPDSTIPVNITDTIALRMAGNIVQVRIGANWQTAGSVDFPFFIQDTAFANLVQSRRGAPVTARFGTLADSSSLAYGWFAAHEAGVGLSYFRNNGIPSVCGAANTTVRRVSP